MLWLVLGICAGLTAAVLGYALLRRPRDVASRVEHDLEVYRAQLRELERERESGLIGDTEAAAAKLEIERRVLAADRDRPAAVGQRPRQREWLPAALVAGLVPLAAIGLYAWIGSPEVPAVPFSEQAARQAAEATAPRDAAEGTLPDVETMLARVRERLAENPDDLRGWAILARSAAAIGQFDEAIAAYDQAIRLAGDEADLLGGKAEAMILKAQGQVPAEARAILREAVKRDPENARVRYYLALAKQQDGDSKWALDDFAAMLRDAPADAPWLETVRQRAAGLAQELGLDPTAFAAAGPAAADDPRAAAEQLAANLEAEPKDFRGWIALAQARAGLGDRDGARAALDRGAQVYEGAPFVLQQFEQAALDLGLSVPDGGQAPRGPGPAEVEAARSMTPAQQEEMIRGMVGGLADRLASEPDDLQGWQMLARSYGVLKETEKAAQAYGRVLALAPEDPDALFFLGEAAQMRGDSARAAELWTRLLTVLAPGSAEHAMVQERLNGLKAAN
jgi:cytochrome c-type biogenesis protein CcmH